MQVGRIPVSIVVLWEALTAGLFLIYSSRGSHFLLQFSDPPNLKYLVGGYLVHLFSLKLDFFTPLLRTYGMSLLGPFFHFIAAKSEVCLCR